MRLALATVFVIAMVAYASANDRSHYYPNTTTTVCPTTTTTTVPHCTLQCPAPSCPPPVVNVPACPACPTVILPAPVCPELVCNCADSAGCPDVCAPCATIDDIKSLVDWLRFKKCRVTPKGVKCNGRVYLQGYIS